MLPICFFVWLAAITLFHGGKYYEQRKFAADKDETPLFATMHEGDGGAPITNDDDDGPSFEDALEEPLLDDTKPASRRDVMKKNNLDASGQGYFYQTAYFDRINLKQPSTTSLKSGTDDDGGNEKVTPREVYKEVAASEESEADMKWYHRVWRFLPFTALWGLAIVGTRDTCRCCARKGTAHKSEFQDMPCGKKTWFVFTKIIKVLVNLICFFIAIVSVGDSHQSGVTRSKLPFVHSIYRGLNDGQVCAFDKRCGNIDTFDSMEDAHAANYSIAHCGKCAGCSTWQDLSVQWTTRKQAATLAQSCGIRYLFDQAGMAKCLARGKQTELLQFPFLHSSIVLEC